MRNDANEKNCYIVPFHGYRTAIFILTWSANILKSASKPNPDHTPTCIEGPFNLKEAKGKLSIQPIPQDREPFCPSTLEEVLSVIAQDPKQEPDPRKIVSSFVLVLKPIIDETRNTLENLEKVLFYNTNFESEAKETEEYKTTQAILDQTQHVLKQTLEAYEACEEALEPRKALINSIMFREFSGEEIRQALARRAAPVNNSSPKSSLWSSLSSDPDGQASPQGHEKGCSIC